MKFCESHLLWEWVFNDSIWNCNQDKDTSCIISNYFTWGLFGKPVNPRPSSQHHWEMYFSTLLRIGIKFIKQMLFTIVLSVICYF